MTAQGEPVKTISVTLLLVCYSSSTRLRCGGARGVYRAGNGGTQSVTLPWQCLDKLRPCGGVDRLALARAPVCKFFL